MPVAYSQATRSFLWRWEFMSLNTILKNAKWALFAFLGLVSSFYSGLVAQMHIDQQVPSSKVPLKRSELLGLVSLLQS